MPPNPGQTDELVVLKQNYQELQKSDAQLRLVAKELAEQRTVLEPHVTEIAKAYEEVNRMYTEVKTQSQKVGEQITELEKLMTQLKAIIDQSEGKGSGPPKAPTPEIPAA